MDTCRICLDETPPLHRIPCSCRGTVAWIHKECLEKWFEYLTTPRCDLCGRDFHYFDEVLHVAKKRLLWFAILYELWLFSCSLCVVCAYDVVFNFFLLAAHLFIFVLLFFLTHKLSLEKRSVLDDVVRNK